MESPIPGKKFKYIINENDEVTDVIIDIETFEALLEQVESSHLGAQEETLEQDESEHIPHEKVERELSE